MPENIRPRVNEAREFLEIAKDFKDPKEIIREALSNSWDAGATNVRLAFTLVRVPGTKRNKIQVEIRDDGAGMSSEPRGGLVTSSEIEGFFNLGDSSKLGGSIGSKGHGTKIYYKSLGITVDTWKDGRRIHAETEVAPWDTLLAGKVPTYRYTEEIDEAGKGTLVFVDGFQAKQAEFTSIDNLRQYIHWYTIVGSFGHYFGAPRSLAVEVKPADTYSPVTLPFGFSFPPEQLDISEGTESACKMFGPIRIECGETEDGKKVSIDVVGAIIGEDHRNIVPHTYSHMGLWLSKDYIRVERKNEIIEDVFGGQYYYRSMLLFANSQSFDLTANRNNVRTDQEEYDLAVNGIKKYLNTLRDDDFTKAYFGGKREEDDYKRKQAADGERRKRRERAAQLRRDRLNSYKARTDLDWPTVKGAPLKEPVSEAETALLLQAMISSEHPGIDFRIGDYNTARGVDLVVEQVDKDIPSVKWAEIVATLDKLYAWPHPPEGYHIIICYHKGAVKEVQTFADGMVAKLVAKEKKGRYALMVGDESIDVYVLRELLERYD